MECSAGELKHEGRPPQPPAVLAELTHLINEKIDFLRTMRNSDDGSNIQSALETFPEDKLTALKEVLEQKRAVYPHSKLQKLAVIFMGEFDVLKPVRATSAKRGWS